jgi:hypothetical protein
MGLNLCIKNFIKDQLNSSNLNNNLGRSTFILTNSNFVQPATTFPITLSLPSTTTTAAAAVTAETLATKTPTVPISLPIPLQIPVSQSQSTQQPLILDYSKLVNAGTSLKIDNGLSNNMLTLQNASPLPSSIAPQQMLSQVNFNGMVNLNDYSNLKKTLGIDNNNINLSSQSNLKNLVNLAPKDPNKIIVTTSTPTTSTKTNLFNEKNIFLINT